MAVNIVFLFINNYKASRPEVTNKASINLSGSKISNYPKLWPTDKLPTINAGTTLYVQNQHYKISKQ